MQQAKSRIDHALCEALRRAEAAGSPPGLATAIRHAVMPGGARILPNAVKDGEVLQTALKGETLTVKKVVSKRADGKAVGTLELLADKPGAKPVKVGKFNIIAGGSMVHIVDGVLTPKAL